MDQVDMNLMAVVVTAIVFLAGFMSLRIHYTLNAKKRALEGVVESVTTTPGYADTLRALDDRVHEAGQGTDKQRHYRDFINQRRTKPEWQVAALRLDEGLGNPALNDRDLRPVRAHLTSNDGSRRSQRGRKATEDALLQDPLPWGPRGHRPPKNPYLPVSDRVTFATLVALFSLFAVAMVLATLATLLADLSLTQSAVSVFVSAVVIVVAVCDVRSVEGELESLAAAVELSSPTATWWEQRDPHESPARDPAKLTDRSALVQLGHADDAIDLSAHARHADLNAAARLLPEWSTPRALLAYQGWLRSGYALTSREAATGASAQSSMDEIEHVHHAAGHAHAAVMLNPLDPGCRLLLAALEIDLLAHLMDHQSAASGRSNGGLQGLVSPLPLSKVTGGASKDEANQADDWSRVFRWRYSRVLQRAKQASALVTRHWREQRSYRSATGKLTELDFISVDFQLGRAYALNACVQPATKDSRGNAKNAMTMLHQAERGRHKLGKLPPQDKDQEGGTAHAALPPLRTLTSVRPRILCLPHQDQEETLGRSAKKEIELWRELVSKVHAAASPQSDQRNQLHAIEEPVPMAWPSPGTLAKDT